MELRRINTARSNNRLISAYGTENKYGINNKTALFIISGEKRDVGVISCINNEVSEIFGFDKSEMIGNNISKVMPYIIAEKHSQFILNHFKAEKQRRMENMLIFPMHKHGYIIPCSFLLRIIPNLRRGLQLIGFLTKVTDLSEYCPSLEKNLDPDDAMIFLTDSNWMLHCFNIKAAHIFGIVPSLANLKKYHSSDEKVPVPQFLPELEDPEFLTQAQSPLSANIFVNIKAIRKAMESEVEFAGCSSGQENFGSFNVFTPSHETYVAASGRRVHSMSSDDTMKCQLTFMKLSLGNGELKLNLIIGASDLLLDKYVVKVNELDMDIQRQPTKK